MDVTVRACSNLSSFACHRTLLEGGRDRTRVPLPRDYLATAQGFSVLLPGFSPDAKVTGEASSFARYVGAKRMGEVLALQFICNPWRLPDDPVPTITIASEEIEFPSAADVAWYWPNRARGLWAPFGTAGGSANLSVLGAAPALPGSAHAAAVVEQLRDVVEKQGPITEDMIETLLELAVWGAR